MAAFEMFHARAGNRSVTILHDAGTAGTTVTFGVQGAAATAQSADQFREQIRERVRQATEEATRASGEGARASARVRVGPGDEVIVTRPGEPAVVVGGTVLGGHPGSMMPHPVQIPPQAVDMAMGFFIMCAVIVVGWPIARAFGRRIERGTPTALPEPSVAAQLQRIEQSVEAMAIEVERISESQRFIAKLRSRSGAETG